MKSLATRCNPNRLEAFLAGDLKLEEEATLAQHIEECPECQRQIESLAAEPDSWHEAHTFLQPTVFHATQSPSDERSKSPLQVRSVLDSLTPTDDPEMLGRLGSYEVSGVVGVGGMGVVLKAFDRSLDRTVAIKVLSPHLATSGAAKTRFAREAKATAAVLHPNVIAIHGVANDDDLPWLVMPYVRGHSLQKRIDQEGPLPVSEILRIGSQIAAGLSAAHAQGLVHRDIKPANVLLEEGVERVTITDFGLARAVDDATMTRSGIIAGTPQYMSPEQARGEAVDGRSDLFSLGSVLYAMCTGHSPFRAETTYGVMRRITDERARPIRETNSNVPEWLSHIIHKLMAKQPATRFQSSAEVAELLEECLAHVQQPTQIPLPDSCRKLKPLPTVQTSQPGQSSFYKRPMTGIILACVFGLLGALGALLWQASDPPEIAGAWSGNQWGTVTFVEIGKGRYEGTFTETTSAESGSINLKWSKLEKRFNGKWNDGDLRNGKISLRIVDGELRGAWTTSKKSARKSGDPRLAELVWTREIHDGENSTGDSKTRNADRELIISADKILLTIRYDPNQQRLEKGQLVDVYGIRPVTRSGKQVLLARPIAFGIQVYAIHPHTDQTDANSVNLLVSKDRASHLISEQTRYETIRLIPCIKPEQTKAEIIERIGDLSQRFGSYGSIDVEEARFANRDLSPIPAAMKVVSIKINASDIIGAESIEPRQTLDIRGVYFRSDGTRVKSAPFLKDIPVFSVTRITNDELIVGLVVTAKQAETIVSVKKESGNDVELLATQPRATTKDGRGIKETGPDPSQPNDPDFDFAFRDDTLVEPAPGIGVTDFFGDPAPRYEAGMTLGDAVERFNEYYSDYSLAKDRNPLTENEVVAAMRWAARDRKANLDRMSDENFEEFCSIYKNRVLPEHWTFEILTDFGGMRGEKFKAWTIRISVHKPDQHFVFGIRDQTLYENTADPDATPPRPDEIPKIDPDSLDPNGMPLLAAIKGFNVEAGEMEPLTYAEVVASIKRAYRYDMPLTNAEYSEFLKIAEFPYELPEGYKLEKLTSYGDTDGGKYLVWSVRLVIPRTSKPGSTYAHMIRNQFISYKESDEKRALISWGPVADNGLQAGVRLKGAQDSYSPGAVVTPEFFIRNTGDEKLKLSVPRLMAQSYYNKMYVLDGEADREVKIAYEHSRVPVGWLGISDFGFGKEHHVNGVSMLLGGCPERDDEPVTRIYVQPGESGRLFFNLPNFGDKDSTDLITGEIEYKINK